MDAIPSPSPFPLEDARMRPSRTALAAATGLVLLAAGIGLFGHTGFVYAADRTVVGELWSADG